MLLLEDNGFWGSIQSAILKLFFKAACLYIFRHLPSSINFYHFLYALVNKTASKTPMNIGKPATFSKEKLIQLKLFENLTVLCNVIMLALVGDFFQRKLNEALAGPVEALLDGAGDDAWPAPNKKMAGSAWD
ncbi:hypothetical protein FXO38_21455 [Capsicum annuum]|nr:hypothetical protein FXO38_21455 [Capsicum annuum]